MKAHSIATLITRSSFVTLLSLTWPAVAQTTMAQAPSGPTAVEDDLFNDMAARLEQNLNRTAGLLAKLRTTQDPQERKMLLADYHKTMQTTMKISHLMHALQQPTGPMMGGAGQMGQGKMQGGMMMGGKCPMMGGKGAAKAAAGRAETSEQGEDEGDDHEQKSHKHD